MRTLAAVLISVVLLPAAIAPDRSKLPTVSAESVMLGDVRRASEMDAVTELADSGDTLVAERPVGARAGSLLSVFVVDDEGVLRRIPVTYGRASPSQIQIVSGVSPGDRIVVSDMRDWDAFERIRLRFR